MLTTKATSDQAVATLLGLAIDEHGQRSKVTWPELEAASGIGYSRAWLLVQRTLMERNSPALIVDTQAVLTQAQAEHREAGVPFDSKAVLGEVVRTLRMDEGVSWGEISVRLNMPESQVRAVFRHNSTVKDVGLRIGRGGRWLNGDPTLYQAHRAKEGAFVPGTIKRAELKPEVLVNYEAKAAEVLGTQRLSQGVDPNYAAKVAAEAEKAREARKATAAAKRAAKKASTK